MNIYDLEKKYQNILFIFQFVDLYQCLKNFNLDFENYVIGVVFMAKLFTLKIILSIAYWEFYRYCVECNSELYTACNYQSSSGALLHNLKLPVVHRNIVR